MITTNYYHPKDFLLKGPPAGSDAWRMKRELEAAPGDRTTMLVYADALEDSGWAGFAPAVRRQAEDRDVLFSSEVRVGGRKFEAIWECGLLRQVNCPSEGWRRRGPGILATHPSLSAVTPTDLEPADNRTILPTELMVWVDPHCAYAVRNPHPSVCPAWLWDELMAVTTEIRAAAGDDYVRSKNLALREMSGAMVRWARARAPRRRRRGVPLG